MIISEKATKNIAIQGLFWKFVFTVWENYMKLTMIYHCYQKKIEKLVSSFNDKKKYVVHVRNLKQPIKNKLVLQNLHRIIELSQKACFKQYIDMNSQLQ